MSDVKFENNMPRFERRFESAVKKALRLVGGQAERNAKEMISDMEAVDTGFLRNSITFALAGEPANQTTYHDNAKEQHGKYAGVAPEDDDGCWTVYIGTNVYYAPYIEYGTRKMRARPFLTNSIQQNVESYKELFKQAFEAFR